MYRLIYFDFTGRAESIRLLFSAAQVEFEDVRLTSEQWQAMKDSTPTGKLPLLEVDGKKLPESWAILRFLARKFHFEGLDEIQCAAADAISCCIEDMFADVPRIANGRNDEEKMKAREHLETVGIPLGFKKLIAMKKLYGEGDYLVGSILTYADILMYAIFNVLKYRFGIKYELPDELKAVMKSVESNPGIASYLKCKK
ncbi:hypothetical protein GJ496_009269 [Pomphorhynchus laevis]|nr:hypothetical protein GJ496_008924 [Pomphorhynchus laevis]KAI0990338.1 hypothetical protein GJ496_009268 [Pomphorhynchus laevis]KAI0990339.1 hypothetical protein GJ496_009269 [Pomphorhynchus laevis]